MTDKITKFLAEQKRHAEAQAVAYERMLELDGGCGRLGVRHPEMFEDMMAWQDSTENEHADTVLRLVAALEAVGDKHRKITRYGNDRYSIDAETFAEYPSDYEDMEPFDLCAECYEVEKLICEECGGDNAIGHRSAWPCPTIRAVEAALGGESDE